MKRENGSEESGPDEKKLCLDLDPSISPSDNDSRQEDRTEPVEGTLRPLIYACDRQRDDETPAPVDDSPSPSSHEIDASLSPPENAPEEVGVATNGPEAEEKEVYFHPPFSVPLTRRMLEDNQNALTSGKPDDVVRKMSAHSITREDLTCLKPTEWLTDTLIDSYLELMKQNYQQEDGKYRKTYVFYSTFYNLLAKSMDLVKDTADDVNIFEFDLLLFPVCVTSHWRLIVANIPDRTVHAYNSMESFSAGDKIIVRKIMTYLTSEHKRVMSRQNEDENEKKRNGAAADTPRPASFTGMFEKVPQQGNPFDCGIFVLLFANYLWRNTDFDFGQLHVPYFRQKIFYELLTGQLLS